MENKYVPRLIAFELTRKCLLNCRHCRAGASFTNTDDELSTKEIFKILQNLKNNFSPIIILTGGEPMTRKDIFKIASYGTSLGLRMTMAPCGLLINDKTMRMIKKSGIQRISLSLDGATPEVHDEFRQEKGSFNKIMEAAESAKKHNVEFQINTTIHKNNINELPKILETAISLGAKSFHPFILVPVGRAKNLDINITLNEYESILSWFAEINDKSVIFCKPTCAPHYYRILKELDESNKFADKAPQNKNGMNLISKGCAGGQSFGFISSTGKIQICGFLEITVGDLRKENYNFSKIWNDSLFLKEIRDVNNYHGKCSYCEYNKICGGCRARAFAFYNDYLGEEPYCSYKPELITGEKFE